MHAKTRTPVSATSRIANRLTRRRQATELTVFAVALTLTAWSAIAFKEAGSPAPVLLATPESRMHAATPKPAAELPNTMAIRESTLNDTADSDDIIEVEVPSTDADIRWFDGVAMKPARVMWMKVTAYSPDAASCAPFDDGLTATMKSVTINDGRLVAADPKVLPMHTLISVPGYHDNEIVPVLDKGGRIKGARLDVLYPTHRRALKWGVQWLPITIWEPVKN